MEIFLVQAVDRDEILLLISVAQRTLRPFAAAIQS